MNQSLQALYPPANDPVPLIGCYLSHQLHQKAVAGAQPFVYSNYVSSIDGRIALAVPGRKSHEVPSSIANPRDWRLYQELAAQADILVTSARYFRQSQVGEEQDRLPVGREQDFEDLHAWRQQQGLAAQPDLVILSSSLDIPLGSLTPYSGRKILIASGEDAPVDRVRALEEAGATVLPCGPGRTVNGRWLVEALGTRGYRSVYAIAGPSVLYTLLNDGALNRLYLTFAHRLLAGEAFDTITWGPTFPDPVSLQLASLYLDSAALDGAGQLLASYDCRYP